jgi:hypothetical protein
MAEGLSVQSSSTVAENVGEATQKSLAFPPSFASEAPGLASKGLVEEGNEFVTGPEDEDEDQREQREIIQQCLAEGLTEDRILEILDEWANQKLVMRTQERIEAAPQRANAVPLAAEQPTMRISGGFAQADTTSPPGSGGSLAASRQAKAKKSISIGPTDAEVVDILQDYAKENLTPSESSVYSQGNALSLADKRKKDKEPSLATVGSYDSDKARAAYLQSRSQMDKMKNQARAGGQIF